MSHLSLEDLTKNIVQLCDKCNVWSSTINIPHGKSDVLDISDACGPNPSTPNDAKVYPDQCPNGSSGSYYTFDPNLYGENSWDDLKSMLMTPGCVSGCTLVQRSSRGRSHYRKCTRYLCCTHSLLVTDKSNSVYDGDNVGKSHVKPEFLKRNKRSKNDIKLTRAMMSKKQLAKLQQSKKAPVDKKHLLKKPDVRRTVSGRAIDKDHSCQMKICVFQTHDNRWHLQASTSNLQHSFHPELDDDAKALGEKDLDHSEKHLVSSIITTSLFVIVWLHFVVYLIVCSNL
jgi:hypothetical protein